MIGRKEWVGGMLGLRRETPMWAYDLVWQTEMLDKRQGTPRWADGHVWYLWRVLEYKEWQGKIHNNKRQSLGFDKSLTEAWKNHLIISSQCSPPETG